MTDQYKILHPTKYYKDFLKHKIRPDSREFDTFRPITVNVGSISTADGSSLAKIGNTTVCCGIKAELCKPKAEHPSFGFIVPNVELSPLCSPRFKPGPPCDQAQITTQLVADIIKNSKCLDLEALCICADKLVWCLYADLVCLDFDGALLDCCTIALMAALKTVKLPAVEYDSALDSQIVNVNDRKGLTIANVPCSTTFVTFDSALLIDPTVEEEDLSTSQIIVVTKKDELCLVHKPGGLRIKDDVLFKCIEDCKKRSKIIEGLISGALESRSEIK